MVYHFDSPFGNISYDWDGKVCLHIWLNKQSNLTHDDPVSQWLTAYFNGKLLHLPPLGSPATSFQGKLRAGLLSIPKGETCSYGELALQLGTSPRGLGQALGANPLPIVIPCHRVVSAKGLGGFAYGPIWKEKLLAFES